MRWLGLVLVLWVGCSSGLRGPGGPAGSPDFDPADSQEGRQAGLGGLGRDGATLDGGDSGEVLDGASGSLGGEDASSSEPAQEAGTAPVLDSGPAPVVDAGPPPPPPALDGYGPCEDSVECTGDSRCLRWPVVEAVPCASDADCANKGLSNARCQTTSGVCIGADSSLGPPMGPLTCAPPCRAGLPCPEVGQEITGYPSCWQPEGLPNHCKINCTPCVYTDGSCDPPVCPSGLTCVFGACVTPP